MSRSRVDECFRYRWRRSRACFLGQRHLPCRGCTVALPAINPRNVPAKATAKVHRGLVQGQLPGGCPQLELVAVAVAAMARVAADRHVHRERATTMVLRQGLMQRTIAVPLRPRSSRGLESKQAQDLLHRNLGANSVEIYTRHGCSSGGELIEPHSMTRWLCDRRTVPFPLISLWGTGTTLFGRSVQALPTSGRAAKPASPFQRLQHLAQPLVLDPQGVPELCPCHGHALAQKVQHAFPEAALLPVRGELGRNVPHFPDDLQVSCLFVGRDQLQIDRRCCRRRAMLAREHQVLTTPPQIEVRIAEGMDVTRAAQSLASGSSPRGVLPRVMHQQNRQVELPL